MRLLNDSGNLRQQFLNRGATYNTIFIGVFMGHLFNSQNTALAFFKHRGHLGNNTTRFTIK